MNLLRIISDAFEAEVDMDLLKECVGAERERRAGALRLLNEVVA